jgi:adhesin transport system membrane fusion protein
MQILPGMQAQVDVLTGKKTVLQYLLKPVVSARENALRER